jgi:hypothetical protein
MPFPSDKIISNFDTGTFEVFDLNEFDADLLNKSVEKLSIFFFLKKKNKINIIFLKTN